MTIHNSSRHALCAFLAAIWILLAAVLALHVIPAPWQGLGGRDLRPQGTTLFVLLIISSMVLRYIFRWSWLSLLGGLALVEVIVLLLIGYFSGADLLSPFNLRSLLFANIFIAIPWLIGITVGSWALWYKAHQVCD